MINDIYSLNIKKRPRSLLFKIYIEMPTGLYVYILIYSSILSHSEQKVKGLEAKYVVVFTFNTIQKQKSVIREYNYRYDEISILYQLWYNSDV